MVDKYNNEIYEIDEETMKKMKAKMLEMLLYFKDFCQEHGLMFYLIGGGAIGAVREHGFLTWDDDVDCAMPRPDYERFKELWEKYGDKEKYVYCRTDEKTNYHHESSSLRDPKTTFICKYNQHEELCHGLALEFGCFDACPKSKIARAKQIFYGMIYSLFNNQRLPNNKGGLFRFVAKIMYKLVPSKEARDRIWRKAEKEKSKYSWDECEFVKELGGSIKAFFLPYPKEWFSTQVWVDFEGHKMPLMAGYHQYLTGIFGDYMTPPPESERVAKHVLDFVDMDHPYTDYRGIKYFPGSEKQGGAV